MVFLLLQINYIFLLDKGCDTASQYYLSPWGGIKNRIIKYTKSKELTCNFTLWVGRVLGRRKKHNYLGAVFPWHMSMPCVGTHSDFKDSSVNGKMPRELALRYLT